AHLESLSPLPEQRKKESEAQVRSGTFSPRHPLSIQLRSSRSRNKSLCSSNTPSFHLSIYGLKG
ncbi:MAG: hypothetical protein OEX00_08550, partial [Gammaproteobacteria bacterium]|nr:hypothetical protein [Gammaproteobacteria bacterium]